MTDPRPAAYGTIAVVGGGCYGSYYVRQLQRARAAGRATWTRLIVVDRDSACRVALAQRADGAAAAEWQSITCAAGEWSAWFPAWLSDAARDRAGHAQDTIVPSPLMPHLLFEWLLAEARRVDPRARAATPEAIAEVPWQRTGADGTRYVSFATWMCPINCIEPAKCPHSRNARDWSLHRTLPQASVAEPTVVLGVTHRVFGVGMVDVAAVLDAREAVLAGVARRRAVRVGTASHCHGAVATIRPAG